MMLQPLPLEEICQVSINYSKMASMRNAFLLLRNKEEMS